jgi:cell division protein FtsW (lipid II flippase)
MEQQKAGSSSGHLLLFFCTCLLVGLFARLYQNLQPGLLQAKNDYQLGKSVNLDSTINRQTFLTIIDAGNYFTDPKDKDLLADSLLSELAIAGEIENLGALNKQPFGILAPIAWQSPIGGQEFQSRLIASRIRLGFDSLLYQQEITSPKTHSSSIIVGSGSQKISGKVMYDEAPMAGVLVQLQQHIASTKEDSIPEPSHYARTNPEGQFEFIGLEKDSGYSVAPLKPGYEFGSRQGSAELSKNMSVVFKAKLHTVRLMGSSIFNQVKDDKIFTVRTTQAFERTYWTTVIAFVLAFWLLHIFWVIRRFRADVFILPILMLLTGISILVLFDIQEPLQDTLHAWQAVQGVVIGLLALAVFSQLNFGKLYTRWWFDGLFNFKKKNIYNQQGFTWLALAVAMAIITLVIGTGPEGSGVKVNLQLAGLSFQPSEITKYLLLFFLAGFFAATEEQIRNLSDIRWKLITSWSVMAGTTILLMLYLMMGDMGPALVICFTFLFFYSIACRNLGLTLGAGLLYGGLLWLLEGWIATVISFAVTCIFIVWKGSVRSSKWYGWLAIIGEAPIILLLIMAAFSFGDKMPGVGNRLADRKSMWLSPWNNDVYGGDHLAHAYWTLSSGGVSGQGLGKGLAKTMPAAHTDMILPSIGESLGWLGLVAIFLLFAILVHRSFLHARRAGQPFLFYLCAGIAIATGVQFLLIAGGSIGLLPLTGVTVPFLSYGKVSLIINLAAMGILAGISARPGAEIQREYIQKHYDPVLFTGSVGFILGIFILVGTLAWQQLYNGKELITKPSRVVNRNGEPVYSYNPRIEKLTRMLGAGSIYDRNNLILASGDVALINNEKQLLTNAGVNSVQLSDLLHKRARRYYPFGEDMFFWTGDYNTRLFWGQSNGYFAETAHLSELRGFDTRPAKAGFVTTRYKRDRFTKPVEKNVTLIGYDYSVLASMLRKGIDTVNPEIKALKAKNRDVHLAVDASLQTKLQQSLDTSKFSDRRISIVVLDAGTGDILASAMHPRPNLQAPELMALSDRERLKLPFNVTERDLGMSFPTAPGSAVKILTATAAFNKLGDAATEQKYKDISFNEIIRKGSIESEPYNPRWAFIDMKEAIINSSNVFFIRMANDHALENELSDLYLATGMKVGYKGGYSFSDPYSLNEKQSIKKYWSDSIYSINKSFYAKQRLYGSRDRYNGEFSGLAWGQGQLGATPASMARIAGIIANGGVMQPSRYVLEQGGIKRPPTAGIRLTPKVEYADKIRDFMILQSNVPGRKGKVELAKVAGKTGTPQRVVRGQQINDGWYVFFTPTPDGKSHTVVCIRIEEGQASSNAVKLANEITPILKEKGYLGSF